MKDLGQDLDNQEDTPPKTAEIRYDVIQEMCVEVSKIGLEVLDSSGNIDALSNTLSDQVGLSSRLREMNGSQLAENERAQDAINETIDLVKTTTQDIVDFNEKINSAVSNINAFIESNKVINDQIGGLNENINDVLNSVQSIMEITKGVRILALNATIEAARAGEAGKGFQIVANEVKVLAGSTADATQQIADSIKALAGAIQTMVETNTKNSALAETTHQDALYIGEAIGKTANSIQTINERSADILSFSHNVQARSREFDDYIKVLDSGLEDSHNRLDSVKERLYNLTDLNERIGLASIKSGIEMDDTFFVNIVREGARLSAEAFERALQLGEISESELFDFNYVPVKGSNPEQVLTKFTAITDKYMPDIQEPILGKSDRIVFCAAVDKNGYLPTHNKKFSQPQRPNDPEWNASNCRNRRIFNDRVGLRSGQNSEDFLVQLYRRDMGGGNYILMKDASCPIYVRGRHWGGFRMGYKV